MSVHVVLLEDPILKERKCQVNQGTEESKGIGQPEFLSKLHYIFIF